MEKPNKVCCFYVSDWHFITMLLPHIDKMIHEDTNMVTVFEENFSNKMEILLSKLHLKNEKKIRRIDWGQTTQMSERIKEAIALKQQGGKMEFIISGSNQYIENVNQMIENQMPKNLRDQQFKIVNCYAVENCNVAEVLKKHDAILNTAGEKSKQAFLKGL